MTEKYKLIIEINDLPKLPNQNMYKHWAVKFNAVKKWKNLVHHACIGKKPELPLQKAKITYTRFSSRKPDYDNIVASFKPIQDGLKESLIIADDTWDQIIAIYAWEKAPTHKGSIKVEVQEA